MTSGRAMSHAGLAVLACSVVLLACSNSSSSDDESLGWCDHVAAAANALDSIELRAELPRPAELRADIEQATNSLAAATSDAPEDAARAIDVLAAAVRDYAEVVEATGFDLLAAQTQGTTEDQVALLGLDADESHAARAQLDAEFVRVCES